jgi:exopolysaccharide biosynthesis predicted pyruvyltransferase EpsI
MTPFQQNRRGMEAFLGQFSGQEILYHPNPGNGGDSLIALGTYEAFRRANITFKITGLDDDVAGKTVFLAGGGNLVPLYWDILKAYRKFFGQAARIILLPHTIRGHDELLAELDERCTIFCRDAESYIHVASLNTRVEIYLEHDMACHIDPGPFLADPENADRYGTIVTEKLAAKELDLSKKPLVNFFRVDWESARTVQTSDMDISAEFTFGVWPDNARKAAWCMLKTVSMATFVQTDRLHVAVSCALTATRCLLYDNSYGKNGGVYRHSLRNRTPFIKFRQFDTAERGLHHAAF